MLTNPDFRDLLSVFRDFDVQYLVVGGYAVMRYTEPRYTKDLDVWIATDEANARRVFAALRAFGAPLKNLSSDDFAHGGSFYQMGEPPFRLDVMMSIPGVDFQEAWKRREVVDILGLPVSFISRSDLMQAKRASGRPQDLLDLSNLEKSEQADADDNNGPS